ncbi:MAG: LysR family transcriptional regulator [Synergistaceae bacterium]|nr:LysR family transcriptional regulator [Synergistaceae bacterium]
MFEYKEYIYAVYKHKSFSKAADSLFISQSTLSLMVKKAERLLGHQSLIERRVRCLLLRLGLNISML